MSKPDDPAPLLISELLYFGLGVGEIANQANLSRTSIYRLANGWTQNPSHNTVMRLQRLRDHTAKSAAMPKVGIVTKKL